MRKKSRRYRIAKWLSFVCRKCVKIHLLAIAIFKNFRGYTPRTPLKRESRGKGRKRRKGRKVKGLPVGIVPSHAKGQLLFIFTEGPAVLSRRSLADIVHLGFNK
jgi:hypothetical protein